MAYEIDFLAVGEGKRSGDAIALRYSDGASKRIHVIDGGDQAAGERMVGHIRKYYGNPSYIDAVICTHGDDDHSSGLREVIKAFRVGCIWMNRPWLYASSIIEDFKDRRMTVASLKRHLREQYPILAEIEDIAGDRGIPIHEAFQEEAWGVFTILAPSRDRYLQLIPEFSRTPEQANSNQSRPIMPRGLLPHAARSGADGANRVTETWDRETLDEDVETSASNESSVVQMAQLDGKCILLTGDAGVTALDEAADYANRWVCDLPVLDFIQVPHHGSRRNVSPTSLDRWLGPRLSEGKSSGTVAYASVAKESTTHPRKNVVNAFMRRSATVYSTKGATLWHNRGMPERRAWRAATVLEFSERVEA